MTFSTATQTKIKLFQSVQKFQRIQGIYPLQPHQRTPFNGKNLLILFCVAQMFLSASAFFIFKAQSMYEFGLTLYASLTEVLTFVCITTTLWKIVEVSKFIENTENFVNKSKYSRISISKYNSFGC